MGELIALGLKKFLPGIVDKSGILDYYLSRRK
jgi:hypothetical protein